MSADTRSTEGGPTSSLGIWGRSTGERQAFRCWGILWSYGRSQSHAVGRTTPVGWWPWLAVSYGRVAEGRWLGRAPGTDRGVAGGGAGSRRGGRDRVLEESSGRWSQDARPCGQSNLRLLLTRFAMVGIEHSPCGSRSRSTSIAAQQNR